MRHALTAVGFRVAGNGEKITGISVSGIAVSGEVELDGGNILWNGLEYGTSVDLYSASVAFDQGANFFTAGEERDLLAGDGWLMMIPQRLDEGATVRIEFEDGTYREISLDIFKWRPGRQVVYLIDLNANTGTGTVTASPASLQLPRQTQFPATQILTVNCTTASGNKDYDMPWTLRSNAPWLNLSLTDYPADATPTVSGTGGRTVWLFVEMNAEGLPRQADIFLGDPADNHIVCTVTQTNI
jgi:hypothetical protein